MSQTVTLFSLRDAPALIEKLLPVQKLSAEVFKERKAGPGQTLTPLGSYWKGRKPLILAKACVLGCLLPATSDRRADLEIFEKLMAMDDESMVIRLPRRPTPKQILAALSIANPGELFEFNPSIEVSESPIDWSDPAFQGVKCTWRADLTEETRRSYEAQLLPKLPYKVLVSISKRPEEVGSVVHAHIWRAVNSHLGTQANSFPRLVEQLGIMRFGRRPRVADTFCGSGQIPFEAAQLGCDVCGSDLSPIAAMLTWGALRLVGGGTEVRRALQLQQKCAATYVNDQLNNLGVELDGAGWRAKAYLYCLEVRCPQTDWLVPLLPSLVISHGKRTIAILVPEPANKSYRIEVKSGASREEIEAAASGTVRSDGRGKDPYIIHEVGGVEFKTKISTLRGDYRSPDGTIENRLRKWEKGEFQPAEGDIFQERLYAVHWMRQKARGKKYDYEFRAVSVADIQREKLVEEIVARELPLWQTKGLIPDSRIEPGDETTRLSRERGWTHWHHLFTPRHLLTLSLLRSCTLSEGTWVSFARTLDYTSRLCRWTTSVAGGKQTEGAGKRTGGASDNPSNVFYNQALNTFFNFGCRASVPLMQLFQSTLPSRVLTGGSVVRCRPSTEVSGESDIFITDPPYGDAVKYEEILEFFIGWFRKNAPPEFREWTWDSRRPLAIKGEGEDFRRDMVTAYTRMRECMPDNGIQVIMFTHQSGSIWADMANIVWASGLRVTAAWYVATETESALRQGNNVKGTVLLVVRKRAGTEKTTRDDLAWDIQEEVQKQVDDLSGLNQEAKGIYRDENVFEDADIQMAGYAAALRVLTRYSIIDGRDMVAEASRPRRKVKRPLLTL